MNSSSNSTFKTESSLKSPFDMDLSHSYKTASSFVERESGSLFLQDPKSLIQSHPCLFSNTIYVKL